MHKLLMIDRYQSFNHIDELILKFRNLSLETVINFYKYFKETFLSIVKQTIIAKVTNQFRIIQLIVFTLIKKKLNEKSNLYRQIILFILL